MALVQPELPGDAVDGTAELLAEGLGAAALFGGDAGPVAAQGALLRQEALLGGKAAAELVEQFAGGDLLARGRLIRRQAVLDGRRAPVPPDVAAGGPLAPLVVDE